MIAVTNKKIIIIAGPNGAGKTTFAGEFLPKEADCPNLVALYKPIADEWALYDNSGPTPLLLNEGVKR